MGEKERLLSISIVIEPPKHYHRVVVKYKHPRSGWVSNVEHYADNRDSADKQRRSCYLSLLMDGLQYFIHLLDRETTPKLDAAKEKLNEVLNLMVDKKEHFDKCDKYIVELDRRGYIRNVLPNSKLITQLGEDLFFAAADA